MPLFGAAALYLQGGNLGLEGDAFSKVHAPQNVVRPFPASPKPAGSAVNASASPPAATMGRAREGVPRRSASAFGNDHRFAGRRAGFF